MSIEPIIAPAPPQMQVVETHQNVAEQEPPTEQQQQTADDVFTREQQEAAAALVALQMGLGLAHSLAIDAFRKDPEPVRIPPKNRPEDEER